MTRSLDKKILDEVKFISVSKGPNRKEKYDTLHDGKNSYDLKDLNEISKLLQFIKMNPTDLQSTIIGREGLKIFYHQV